MREAATHCNTLAATHCNTRDVSCMWMLWLLYESSCNTLQQISCNTLQHTSRNTLQNTARHVTCLSCECRDFFMRVAATHCNKLAATHCNTLAATHCNTLQDAWIVLHVNAVTSFWEKPFVCAVSRDLHVIESCIPCEWVIHTGCMIHAHEFTCEWVMHMGCMIHSHEFTCQWVMHPMWMGDSYGMHDSFTWIHTSMSQASHVNESCLHESCLPYERINNAYGTHDVFTWIHMWTNHASHMNYWHVFNVNESCIPYEWFISPGWQWGSATGVVRWGLHCRVL